MILEALKNRNFVIISIEYGILYGVYLALGALLSPLFEPYGYTSTQISILGVEFIVAGITSCMLVGCFLDYSSKFLLSIRVICWSSTIVALVLTFVFPYGNFNITSVGMVLAGIFLLPIIPVCISFASEVTFPMQPAMINGGVQLSGHLMGFLMEIIASLLV